MNTNNKDNNSKERMTFEEFAENFFILLYRKSKEIVKKVIDRVDLITFPSKDAEKELKEDVCEESKVQIDITANDSNVKDEVEGTISEETNLTETPTSEDVTLKEAASEKPEEATSEQLQEVALEDAMSKEESIPTLTEGVTDESKELTIAESKELVSSGISEFQLKFLNKIKSQRPHMLKPRDLEIIEKANEGDIMVTLDLSEIFNRVLREGYSNYKTPIFNLSLSEFTYVKEMEAGINQIFESKFPQEHMKDFYLNYKIEARGFIDYCLIKKGILDFSSILRDNKKLIPEYIMYLKENCTNVDWAKSEKLLTKFFA